MTQHSLFLTGGTGFFGKSILQGLLDGRFNAGCLTILSRHPQSFIDSNPQLRLLKNLSFIEGDIRTFAFPKEKFDFILHAATPASATLEQQNPDEMRSIIVDGTRHVLDLAKQCACKRFLMTSSGAVYGVQPPELNHIPETFPCNPVTAYGKGKCEAEQMCIAAGAKQGFATLLPRCFAFVGPCHPLDIHFAIGNFIQDCLNNRPILINGDGTPLRSYLSADDLVEWLFKILLQGTHGRPYNVGSDTPISIHELAHLVRQCAGTSNEIIIQKPSPPACASPSRYIPSIARARNELGLTPVVSLTDAIQRTLAWHKLSRGTCKTSGGRDRARPSSA
jgi:dTDP-glucose 4,6-dehydratase